jgi:hypothetical protein
MTLPPLLEADELGPGAIVNGEVQRVEQPLGVPSPATPGPGATRASAAPLEEEEDPEDGVPPRQDAREARACGLTA